MATGRGSENHGYTAGGTACLILVRTTEEDTSVLNLIRMQETTLQFNGVIIQKEELAGYPSFYDKKTSFCGA